MHSNYFTILFCFSCILLLVTHALCNYRYVYSLYFYLKKKICTDHCINGRKGVNTRGDQQIKCSLSGSREREERGESLRISLSSPLRRIRLVYSVLPLRGTIAAAGHQHQLPSIYYTKLCTGTLFRAI